MDFQKAFDKVPHKRLIGKLHSYEINTQIVNRLEAFLSNRKQKVVVNLAQCNFRNPSGISHWPTTQKYSDTYKTETTISYYNTTWIKWPNGATNDYWNSIQINTNTWQLKKNHMTLPPHHYNMSIEGPIHRLAETENEKDIGGHDKLKIIIWCTHKYENKSSNSDVESNLEYFPIYW